MRTTAIEEEMSKLDNSLTQSDVIQSGTKSIRDRLGLQKTIIKQVCAARCWIKSTSGVLKEWLLSCDDKKLVLTSAKSKKSFSILIRYYQCH